MNLQETITSLYKTLYPASSIEKLSEFLQQAQQYRNFNSANGTADWYKDAVVYSLYVDLFNKDLEEFDKLVKGI